MLESEILDKCHFIPKKVMLKVMQIIESREPWLPNSDICRRNLATVQGYRSTTKFRDISLVPRGWKSMHHLALSKAIYAHDWDKLLYVLKKCPPWEHNFVRAGQAAVYFRALTILLMYHPTSQAQGLLNDFLHMVWSCRSDEDKKAILKILLTLPDKIHGKPINGSTR